MRESMIAVIIKNNTTKIESWNAESRTKISEGTSRITTDGNGGINLDDVSRSILNAIETMDVQPHKSTDAVILIEAPVRNEIPTRDVFNTPREKVMDAISQSINRYVHIVNIDDMICLAAWEDTGTALMDDPARQLKWAKSSRIVTLGAHLNSVGISIIDSGRIIGGIDLPESDFPWHHIMGRQISNSNATDTDRGYYRYLLERTIEDYVKPMYDPDRTVVSLDNHVIESISDRTDVRLVMGNDADDLASMGAMFCWIKDRIGWRPLFIDDAINGDAEDDEIIVLGDDDEDYRDLIMEDSSTLNKDDSYSMPRPQVNTETKEDDQSNDQPTNSMNGKEPDDDGNPTPGTDHEPVDPAAEEITSTGDELALTIEDDLKDDDHPTEPSNPGHGHEVVQTSPFMIHGSSLIPVENDPSGSDHSSMVPYSKGVDGHDAHTGDGDRNAIDPLDGTVPVEDDAIDPMTALDSVMVYSTDTGEVNPMEDARGEGSGSDDSSEPGSDDTAIEVVSSVESGDSVIVDESPVNDGDNSMDHSDMEPGTTPTPIELVLADGKRDPVKAASPESRDAE